VGEAELAGGEVAFGGAHGRAEGAAEDGAIGVEVAGVGDGVEDGAGLIFGQIFEEGAGLVVFVEDAGAGVAGEVGEEAGEGGGGAGVDAMGAGGVGLPEVGEAFSEPGGVCLGDGEDAVAALRAAGATGEVRAGAGGGAGEGAVDDLEEVVDVAPIGKAEAGARAECAQKGAEMSGEGLGLLAEDAVEDGVHVLELAGVVEGAGELGGGEAGGNLGDLGDLVPEDEVFFPGAHGVGLD